MSRISCNGMSLKIDNLRSGLKQLLANIGKKIAGFSNFKEIPIHVPKDLTENLNDDRLGFSWLDNNTYTEKPYPLLEYLLQPQEDAHALATLNPNGDLVWKPHQLHRYLAEFSEINANLAVLCFMIPAPPPRATEFTNLRIRNSQLPRNIFMHWGMWFIYRMVKTTNLTSKLSWVPALLPESLAEIVISYMVLIRPLEILFSKLLGRAEAVAAYEEFMWVQHGVQMTSAGFSDVLSKTTEAYADCQIGVRNWRHMSISMIREFVPPRLGPNSVNDLLSNHSSQQAQKTYARETNQLPFLTSDLMLESRDVCSFWHDTLGFGTNDPPIPIRLLSYQARHGYSGESSKGFLGTSVDLDAKLEEWGGQLVSQLQVHQEAIRGEIEDSIQNAVAVGVTNCMAQTGLIDVMAHMQKLTTLLETRPVYQSPAVSLLPCICCI